MSITKRDVNGLIILDIKGRLTIRDSDTALCEAVRSVLEQGSKKILLNLEEVSMIDSAGIGELTETYNMTKKQGGKLKLTNLPGKVRDILSITQLTKVFDIYNSEKEAIESFSE